MMKLRILVAESKVTDFDISNTIGDFFRFEHPTGNPTMEGVVKAIAKSLREQGLEVNADVEKRILNILKSWA